MKSNQDISPIELSDLGPIVFTILGYYFENNWFILIWETVKIG